MKIINKYYDFNKLNKKIVHISDIHYYEKKEINLLNKVLDKINDINPDYVCITGDITDVANVYDEEVFVDWIKKLAKSFKTIIVLGNHEYYIKKKKQYGLNYKLLSKIQKINNLYLLRNENVIIDNINFIGIDLGIDYYFNENKTNINISKFINNKYYNILLCHSPVDIDNIVKDKNVDLVLCGHMHGGVVPGFLRPIFKNRGLISPTKKLFPKYAYGLKKIGNTNIITTSGIRVISHINKFYIFTKYFSSEIVIINA